MGFKKWFKRSQEEINSGVFFKLLSLAAQHVKGYPKSVILCSWGEGRGEVEAERPQVWHREHTHTHTETGEEEGVVN